MKIFLAIILIAALTQCCPWQGYQIGMLMMESGRLEPFITDRGPQ